MTEAEWLAATDPMPMLEFLRGKGSDRRLRLFAVACCRRLLHLVPTKRNQEALEVAERAADGRATDNELRQMSEKCLIRGAHIRTSWSLLSDPFEAAASSAHYMAHAAMMQRPPKRRPEARHEEGRAQGFIVRDIFGNPFRPVAADPGWRTSTVVALAEQMYESHDFSPMPILADALQDAGCDNEDVLDHCRGAGPHVRGCWVVDLILAKS